MSQLPNDPIVPPPPPPPMPDAPSGATRRPQDGPDGVGGKAKEAASTAQEGAGTVATAAKEQVGQTAGVARDEAAHVVQDAKHQAQRLVQDTRSQLLSQANDQSQRLAGSVRDVSQQLQGVARGEGAPSGIVAELVDQAARTSARLAEQLESRDPQDLAQDLRRFARRRPGAFLLGAVGAGFAAGRLVKAVDGHGMVEAAKAGLDEGSEDARGTDGSQRGGQQTSASAPLAHGDAAVLSEMSPAVRP
jgi:hypothetical protein